MFLLDGKCLPVTKNNQASSLRGRWALRECGLQLMQPSFSPAGHDQVIRLKSTLCTIRQTNPANFGICVIFTIIIGKSQKQYTELMASHSNQTKMALIRKCAITLASNKRGEKTGHGVVLNSSKVATKLLLTASSALMWHWDRVGRSPRSAA